jgi:hypothetical protein
MSTLKSPVGARDLGPPCTFIHFIFSYLLLFIWSLPCPPFYFFLSFTPYLALALRALLFFLIFYFLFGPCPACPFIFSLSFILYLAPTLPALLFFLIFYSLFDPYPARPFIFPYLLLFIWLLPLPHGPAPCPTEPCLATRFFDSRDPFSESGFPNPTVWAESSFPNPIVRAGSAGPLKHGTVVGRIGTVVIMYKKLYYPRQTVTI